MADAKTARPGDEKANTLGSILKEFPELKLPTLEKLGLMNAFGKESANMRFSGTACWGKSELLHDGADTFMGHQEIMGTFPKKPVPQDVYKRQVLDEEEILKAVKEGKKAFGFVPEAAARVIPCLLYTSGIYLAAA